MQSRSSKLHALGSPSPKCGSRGTWWSTGGGAPPSSSNAPTPGGALRGLVGRATPVPRRNPLRDRIQSDFSTPDFRFSPPLLQTKQNILPPLFWLSDLSLLLAAAARAAAHPFGGLAGKNARPELGEEKKTKTIQRVYPESLTPSSRPKPPAGSPIPRLGKLLIPADNPVWNSEAAPAPAVG